MKTRGERREDKRRKRGKHAHKTDGAGARLLQNIVMEKARKAGAK
jgi:hypothetical protein